MTTVRDALQCFVLLLAAAQLSEYSFVFISKCIEELERRGLDEEGMYRKPGQVQKASKLMKDALGQWLLLLLLLVVVVMLVCTVAQKRELCRTYPMSMSGKPPSFAVLLSSSSVNSCRSLY